jgi:hypothetical protein
MWPFIPGALARDCRVKAEIAQIAHVEALPKAQLSELDISRVEQEKVIKRRRRFVGFWRAP